MIEKKKCTKCGEEKELHGFPNKNTSRDGKHSHCKQCHSEYHRNRYANNKQKVSEINKKWDSSNKERRNLMRSVLFAENPQKIKLARKKQKARDIKNLADYYIAGLIGIPVSLCTHEILESKRKEVVAYRQLAKMKHEESEE